MVYGWNNKWCHLQSHQLLDSLHFLHVYHIILPSTIQLLRRSYSYKLPFYSYYVLFTSIIQKYSKGSEERKKKANSVD